MRSLGTRGALFLVPALCLCAHDAFAQSATRGAHLAVHVELGGGTMVTPALRNIAQYSDTFQGGIRLGVTVWGPLALQAGLSGWYFPSPLGDGSVTSFAGGVRLEPFLAHRVWLFLDLEGGAGITGASPHGMFDGSVGFEYAALNWLGVGPFVRYGHVFIHAGDIAPDADFWSAGLSVSVRIATGEPERPPPPPPPPDSDHDGVPDRDDLCEDRPEGSHPNPERDGCPDGDVDRDGVLDHQDFCRIDEAGHYPDPEFPGCPMPDDDGDGLPNRMDQCGTVPAGDHADPERLGCPIADADNDGVPDNRDLCTSVARGHDPDPDRLGCPDVDTDHDGVLDHVDDCRNSASGLHPDLSRRGCPQPDTDGDSVPDADDQCATQPGAPSANPLRNGCPGAVIMRGTLVEPLRPIAFDPHGVRLATGADRSLAGLAALLQSTPGIVRIAIEVSSTDEPETSRNGVLSTARAEAVRLWLVTHGIEPARLVARAVDAAPTAPSTATTRGRRGAVVQFRIEEPAMP